MKTLSILIFCLTLSFSLKAQHTDLKVQFGATLVGKRQDADMQKFRSNRFGQFIHWGLYAIPGGMWNGKLYSGASEFLPQYAKIPFSEWSALKDRFNPVRYNPKEWAKQANDLGVKYATVTTKHHDGFCLWPSEFTDFDIENSAYRKDIIGPFVDAYNKAGIDVYLYYSVLDWYHPDWRYNIISQEDKVAFDRYKQYVKNQLLELLKLYPSIKGFWFDGTWDKSWKQSGRFSYELEQELKKAHPGLIVNSRMRADEHGSRHFDSNGRLMGDYESGYERRLPEATDTIVTTRDWEACMTIPENIWGYHKGWNQSHIKRPNEIIEMIAKTTSLGGNFLLNFGPQPDGIIRPEELQIASTIGDWMKLNGSAIYNCDYAGLKKQDWGYFTKNIQTGMLNLIVCNIPVSKRLKLELPKGVTISDMEDIKGRKVDFQQIGTQYYEIILTERELSDDMPFVIKMKTIKSSSNKFIETKALT